MMFAKVVWIQCMLCIFIAADEDAIHVRDQTKLMKSPNVGFWFDGSFVQCRVSFEDFFKCCHRAKCTKKHDQIYDCCTGVNRRSTFIGEDDLAKCVAGVEVFLKDECNKIGRSYCPYDSGATTCCTEPPCNVRKMKEKYCCE